MTIWENIVSDFYWIPSVLSELLDVISKLSPLIALIGAILIYFWQREADRNSELRKRRADIYSQYLSLVPQFTGTVSNTAFNAATPELHELSAQVSLLAPQNVIDASTNFVAAAYAKHTLDEGKPYGLVKPKEGETVYEAAIALANSDEFNRPSRKIIFDARQRLIDEMRKDLLTLDGKM